MDVAVRTKMIAALKEAAYDVRAAAAELPDAEVVEKCAEGPRLVVDMAELREAARAGKD